MSSAVAAHHDLVLDEHSPQDRRVALATLVGTSIEWYDYFIYANAAALVFGPQFFKAVPENMQLILSFATVGVSFLFRPLGAAVAGHYGDRLGRKAMLVLTLLLMGGATAVIGLLPTASTIGVWAPILLVLLRVVQGFSAGGEWGGAALMAVEHAPVKERGKYGAFPQLGVPVGMLLATGFLAMLSVLLSDAQFTSWGWRIPFLFSVVLIGVGMWIRLGVEESPVFQELEEETEEVKMPLGELFRHHAPIVFRGAFAYLANSAAGYMLVGGFMIAYGTKALHMPKQEVLNVVTLAAVGWGITTWLSGILSDKFGRKKVYAIGYMLQLIWLIPLFKLVDTGSVTMMIVAMLVFCIPLGMGYGPVSAMFAEMYPASIRYSGTAMSYALGAILGGAFAPMIAQALVEKYHSGQAVAIYLLIATVISLVATLSMKDRTGARLDKDAPDLQG